MDIDRFQKTKDSAFVPDFVTIQSNLTLLRTEILNRIKNKIQSIDDDNIDTMLENLILYDYNEQTYILRLHINKYGYIRINKTNQRILFNMTFSDGMYESYTLSFDDSINILAKKNELYNLLENVNEKHNDFIIHKREISFVLTDSEISNIYDYIKEVLINYGATVIQHKIDVTGSDITMQIKIKNPIYNL